jgi:aspartyl-tRNA(Asn)/glutamyl-tRNA(Gln) amidotransferase subunit B
MNYEPVIGLEIHVELKTKSGMFCGCPADHFGKTPNTGTCPVCLGLPGALPIPNKKAVEWTIMLGLALGSTVSEVSKFDRKHYFYPDLPKGYQISQYDQPLCRGGKIETSQGTVRIHRVHLEEDTGKLQHAMVDGKKVTLVDFNRSGVPLVEIVTEADIHSADQAKEFLKKLHQIVRYLGISDADMEKGSMRLEPNISIRKVGETALPPYKVEVKNINSFRFAAMAIEYEIKRHATILESGSIPAQETRGWDEAKNATVSQRSKEEAADYRYFPEPDIPPLRFTRGYIEGIRQSMPLLPDERKQKIVKEFGLNEQQATVLIDDERKLNLFESTVLSNAVVSAGISGATVANWIINKVADYGVATTQQVAADIVESQKITVIDESELQNVLATVISSNDKAVADYKKGKQQSLMFLMGQVKRQIPKGNTQQILDALKAALDTQ